MAGIGNDQTHHSSRSTSAWVKMRNPRCERCFQLFPQGTKSLRSSPLRGSKSREAAAGREDSDGRRGKVNTISSCVVGVQRMIKNSKDHLRAGTLMRRVTRPRPITQ
jgi:hypothetical protein